MESWLLFEQSEISTGYDNIIAEQSKYDCGGSAGGNINIRLQIVVYKK